MRQFSFALLILFCHCSGSGSNNATENADKQGSGGNSNVASPENVVNLYALPNNFQITLRWVNPVSANLAGVKVLRKSGGYPTNSTDGTVIFNALGTTVTDTGLSNGTAYYYKAFSYDFATNFSSGAAVFSIPYPSGTAVVGKNVVSASGGSTFYSTAVDSAGNAYVVGYQIGNGTYSYGNGVDLVGINNASTNRYNPVIVKYNTAGLAQWARTITSGITEAVFTGVAIDSADNIVVVGYQSPGPATYGPGVTVSSVSGINAVVVKYNSNGVAQWGKATTAASQDSAFSSVGVDGSGNIFAAGYQTGTNTYSYAPGVSVTGVSTGKNILLVKYDSSGAIQWARSTSAGSAVSEFFATAVNAGGEVFAVGYQTGSSGLTYGTGISVSGNGLESSVLIKYSSGGVAQWARTPNPGPNYSRFTGVALDLDGNVFTSGYQFTNNSYTYGVGVFVSGISANANSVIIKYSPEGNAQWARSVVGGSNGSTFFGLALDRGGNIYAAGYQYNSIAYTYFGGATVSGTSSTANPVLVKFNPSGIAQWAQSISSGSTGAKFNFVAADQSGNIFVVGTQYNTPVLTYGVGVSIAGPVGFVDNATFLRYVQ